MNPQTNPRDPKLDLRDSLLSGPQPAGPKSATRKPQPATNRPVVVTEDDEGLNMLICRRLERNGLATVGVQSGADAIAAVQQHPDCLLLLDYVLPDMDGSQLLDKFNNMGLRVPFVVMTGHGDERVAVEMMKLGARDYIVKQDGFTDLLAPLVERVLAQVATEERLTASQDALHKSEELTRGILSASPDSIKVLDLDGRLLFLNEGGRRLLEIDDLSTVLNTSWPDFWPGEHHATALGAIAAAKAGGTGRFDGLRPSNKGTPRWWEVVVTPLVGPDGKIERLLAASRDITERKRAEAALMVEKERAQEYLDVAGVMLVALDAGGRITLMNRYGYEMLGYSEGELIGQSWVDTCIPERLRNEVRGVISWLQVGAVNPVEYYENPVVTRSGEERLIAWHNVVLRDESGSAAGVLSSGEDITARKAAEVELTKYRDHLEELVHARTREMELANKELEAFSYSVSHDLRAPLRAINGFAQALLDDCAAQLDTTARGYLDRVRVASRRMAELIDHLLNLARIARLPLERKPVNLSELARTIAGELRENEPARQVELVIPDGMTAQADPVLAGMVLRNLLGNAWKFTGKHPTARIEVGETVRDGEPVWFVRDDGAGFDMAYVDNLFAPFQRLHATADFPGTGIGLATVQRIVRRHGGRGWIEGAVEKGATYYFTFTTVTKET